ncbi:LacI family DNA-binding transcriptional regulator [Phycicoccus endophyticus]|nr:LacI family DNA-binding transcriptional regulator [Phycicoccus endophyticus]GGL30237.1 LacI family transcriptional regulator [Phycicoccus endophyticus]
MKDVAARAGVSTATVSRAISGHPSVQADTAQRVLAAAEELGYVPNPLASSLRKQRTQVWALIIADINNPFLTQVARGLEDVASAAGYSVLLCNTDEDPRREDAYIGIAEQYRAAGVVITPTSPGTDVAVLQERGIPVVAVDRPLTAGLDVDAVLIDSRRAARAAVAGLVAVGRRRIGCITGPRRVYTAEERVLGYREALREAHLPPEESLVQYGDYKEEGGRAAMATILENDGVDAVLVANSLMAVGALDLLRTRGLDPGSDVEIIAFDDAPWTALLAPAVRVIHQPAYDVGQAAGQLLLRRIAEPGRQSRTVMLAANLGPETRR